MVKILFITSSRLGDAVISTVVLEALLRQFPLSQITVAGGAIAVPLFNDYPQVKQVIIMNKKKFSGHWLLLWRQVFQQKWDYIVDLRGSALSLLLKTKNRLIFRNYQKDQRIVHQLSHWINSHLKISDSEAAVFLPHVVISPARQFKIDQLLNISDGQKIIAVAPKANWSQKEWPENYFLDLIKMLTTPPGLLAGYKVIICAAPSEHQALNKFKIHLKDQLIRLPNDIELLDLAAVIKRCALFIGNDSGLMHLAAAVGTATYGLFGPSKDRVYHPTGIAAYAIRTPESYSELWCQVEEKTNENLMKSLLPKTVLEKIIQTYRD